MNHPLQKPLGGPGFPALPLEGLQHQLQVDAEHRLRRRDGFRLRLLQELQGHLLIQAVLPAGPADDAQGEVLAQRAEGRLCQLLTGKHPGLFPCDAHGFHQLHPP